MLCVAGLEACRVWQIRAEQRLQSAFRPKTRQCYDRLFRTFVSFCVCGKAPLREPTVSMVLSFLEYLVVHEVSVHMIANYLSAIKAMFILYNIPAGVLDHQRIKYYTKSIKITRTISVPHRNVMDIPAWQRLINLVDTCHNGQTYKAMFLVGYFGFFRLSNLASHTIKEFDPSRHFAGGDVFFGKREVRLILKWSKTLQPRDQVKVITLPKLGSAIYPYGALKGIFHCYNPGSMDPLFQIEVNHKFQVVTDSRVRKTLAILNQAMGFDRSYYTFHSFRRSGATLAYKNRVPVDDIQHHGTWTSDCVWRYISLDVTAGSRLSSTFRKILL